MFGHRYFGARWFGPRYFGPAEGALPAVTTVHEGVRRRRIAQQIRAVHEDDEELAMMIAAAVPVLRAKRRVRVRR